MEANTYDLVRIGGGPAGEPHHRKPTATGMNVVCTSL